MAGIYQNLNSITTIKEEIKRSISEKGIDMSDIAFSDYPEKIDEIVQSGEYQDGYIAGKEEQKSLLQPISITENGTYQTENGYSTVEVKVDGECPQLESIKITENGVYRGAYNEVDVDVPMIDNYENGYSDGIEYQKSKLESVTITDNGTYTKDDGYNKVVVNVPSGGIDKVRVADGLKFAYSTFEEIPGYFDFDSVNSLAYMFYNSRLKICPDLSMANINGLTYTFAKCGSLHTIPLLDCSNVESTYNFLENCISLVNVGGFLNMKASFDLPDAKNLTNESFLNIVNTIYDYTANNETPPQYGYAIIYMSEYMQNTFYNYIHLITQKGWRVMTGF